MIEVRNPANQFFDTDGTPLDNGYIYVGTTGANPETSPQTVYWDKAGTIPAAQPIRTLNGYPSRDGAISKFYTSTKNYSITVKDKRGILVVSTLNSDSGIFDELSDESMAAGVGYDNGTSGLVATNVQAAIDELDSALDTAKTDITNLRSSFSGLNNLFANSAFKINQRGYVSGTATSSSNQYTIDRIRVVVSGEALTITSSTFGNKITAPAGGAEQVIEGEFITGGDYACTWTGSGTITIDGTVKTKGQTFTLTAGTNCVVRMVGDFEKFIFSRPDMIGRYEYDYGRDLIHCMRYFERDTVQSVGVCTNGVPFGVVIPFKAKKRIVPACNYVAGTVSSSVGAASPTITGITQDSVVFHITANATGHAVVQVAVDSNAEIP